MIPECYLFEWNFSSVQMQFLYALAMEVKEQAIIKVLLGHTSLWAQRKRDLCPT